MKNPLNFLLGEKLRQRHLAAELKRSKAFTTAATRPEAKTPLFDAVAAVVKASGKSGDEVLADHFAGKASHPAIDAALEYHKPTKPAIVKPPVAIVKPSPAKPITTTINTMKTPSPTPAPTATAASFATPPLIMNRSEFLMLSDTDKTRFVKAKGKLI